MAAQRRTANQTTAPKHVKLVVPKPQKLTTKSNSSGGGSTSLGSSLTAQSGTVTTSSSVSPVPGEMAKSTVPKVSVVMKVGRKVLPEKFVAKPKKEYPPGIKSPPVCSPERRLSDVVFPAAKLRTVKSTQKAAESPRLPENDSVCEAKLEKLKVQDKNKNTTFAHAKVSDELSRKSEKKVLRMKKRLEKIGRGSTVIDMQGAKVAFPNVVAVVADLEDKVRAAEPKITTKNINRLKVAWPPKQTKPEIAHSTSSPEPINPTVKLGNAKGQLKILQRNKCDRCVKFDRHLNAVEHRRASGPNENLDMGLVSSSDESSSDEVDACGHCQYRRQIMDMQLRTLSEIASLTELPTVVHDDVRFEA